MGDAEDNLPVHTLVVPQAWSFSLNRSFGSLHTSNRMALTTVEACISALWRRTRGRDCTLFSIRYAYTEYFAAPSLLDLHCADTAVRISQFLNVRTDDSAE